MTATGSAADGVHSSGYRCDGCFATEKIAYYAYSIGARGLFDLKESNKISDTCNHSGVAHHHLGSNFHNQGFGEFWIV